MADIFKGLGFGELVKGITNMMPQNEPKTQIFKLEGEIAELKKQEEALYIEIGKKAIEQYGLESFGEISDKMKLVQTNLAEAEQKFSNAQNEAREKEMAEKMAKEGRTCSSCGHENPVGTKFCQECGTKLGKQQNICPSCGIGNEAGVKFCQECGTKLQIESPIICSSCGYENPFGTRFCGDCGAKLEQ